MIQLFKGRKFVLTEFAKVMAIMISIWSICFVIVVFFINTNGVLYTGPFGDTFGIVNSLFSSLALGALWYSIQLQKQELTDTREVLESQSASARQQAFETTFFNMLNNTKSMMNYLTYTGTTSPLCMDLVTEDLKSGLAPDHLRHGERQKIFQDTIGGTHETFYQLAFSLRVLIDFVFAHHNNKDVRRFYLRIVKSSLSPNTMDFINFYDKYHSQASLSNEQFTELRISG